MISEDLHTQRSIFLVEKTLYQKNLKNIALFFFHFSRANDDCNLSSVITPKKIYHGSPRKLMSNFTCKICENTGKILKISCVRCHFVKFDINFLGLPWEN